MTMKKLTSRQVRWTKFLSEFNFVIVYQSGKKNEKADALTRKPHKGPTDNENEQQQHCMRTLLPPKQIELQSIEEEKSKELTLSKEVIESNQEDEICTEIREYLANPKGKEQLDTVSKSLKVDDNGLLRKENMLWVPEDI